MFVNRTSAFGGGGVPTVPPVISSTIIESVGNRERLTERDNIDQSVKPPLMDFTVFHTPCCDDHVYMAKVPVQPLLDLSQAVSVYVPDPVSAGIEV